MQTDLQAAIQPVAAAAIEAAGVPGLVLAVALGDRPVEHLVLGADADGRPLAVDTPFAVASISKLAAALLILRLIEAGVFGLDDELAAHLPEAAAAQPGVTLRRLMSHTAGLPLNLPSGPHPTSPELTWRDLAAACLATPLVTQPMERVQYSNVDYGLLAMVVERRTGNTFGAALAKEVFEPLEIEVWFGQEPERPTARLSDVRGPNLGTPLEQFNSPFWRRLGLPFGGCIMAVDAALALIQAFRRSRPAFLSTATLAEARRNQAGELGGGQIEPLIWPHCPWGLGPELRGVKRPHWAPVEASPDSFGHAGASGCVAWADPTVEAAWVLLGSRTADSGWLLRVGPAIGAAILKAASV